MIQINIRFSPARRMLRVSNFSLNGSSIARSVAIVAVLLLAPLTVSATGVAAHTPVRSEHVATADHHTDHVAEAVQRHDTPANLPQHCHLKSAQPQASGWSQTPVGNDLPLPAPGLKYAHARDTGMRLPAAPDPTSPVTLSRFILFGNFRS
ncbi:MAG: hypothetical protein K2X06_15065 [Burkholderiales bacterium]|nr:hypothetical protein [Burkholderiales bacterium]